MIAAGACVLRDAFDVGRYTAEGAAEQVFKAMLAAGGSPEAAEISLTNTVVGASAVFVMNGDSRDVWRSDDGGLTFALIDAPTPTPTQ